ncbi:hypothetical protein BOX15_Mlig021343g3 [Macrostomum lignano]|uniref:Uncharacterized protein n=1 Tax=Macrostomum lignano TaxID=282301 RepID=A0A267H6B4_9PLAT|nr:hypothetical protein BOX15_Mlig021343g3 [Macrostomum lignano]
MSCPSCSLRLCRRLPLLVQRTVAASGFVHGGHPSLSSQPQFRQVRLQDPMTAEPKPQEEITRAMGLRKFVENITRKPKEARLWFKYFKIFSAKSPRRAFSVMQVSPEVLSDASSVRKLTWSTTFLFENNLTSVLVCQLANDRDFQNVQLLQSLLYKRGVPSRLILGNEHNPAELLSSSHSTLPIVCCPMLGPTDTSAQKTMVHLCSTLRPLKVMLLSQKAGLKDVNGKVISDVYLPTDLDELVSSNSHLSTEDQAKVLRSTELIKHLSCESSVILTSADTVIEELFTHHGSGTMIRQIEKIFRYSSLDSVKKPSMVALINESFQKKLRSNYFERVQGHVESVYVSENYNAAAVILRLPNVSVPYLDKIAVSEIAQGTGISVMLWNQIVKDYPQLFWRSNVTNRAAIAWYNTVSQGSWKADQNWTIFWYGLQTSRQLAELIDYAASKERDFEETPESGGAAEPP